MFNKDELLTIQWLIDSKLRELRELRCMGNKHVMDYCEKLRDVRVTVNQALDKPENESLVDTDQPFPTD